MFQTAIYGALWVLVYLTVFFIQLLITLNNLSSYLRNDVGDKFDYIIVGGGSAGAVLAGRLSQNPNVTVLVVEAGSEGFDILNIPALGPMKQLSELDWQYETVPQNDSCFALENNVSKWPSGKVLGGSTHLNYMVYLKGHKNDYATWKDPYSSHWDWHDINYYYNKAVEHVCVDQYGNCREKRGSIQVRTQLLHTTELSDAILKSATELNYTVNNLNSEKSTGFMKPHLNMNECGKRWTSDQYLKRLRLRENLKVVTKAIAEKILLKDGFEAYAVKYSRFGATKTVYANVEIIVSSGAVGSAKLLMLSGIGPADALSRAKIRTKIDLPVGKNLQDHVTTGLDLVVVDKKFFSFTDLMLPMSIYEYFIHGVGPFTSNMVEALGVIHSRLVDPVRDSPDLEFMVMPAGVSSDKGVFFKKTMGISEKVWENYFRFSVSEWVISILPVLLHPKSIGELTVHPDNPHGKPVINPRYLSNPDDVKTLIEGIRIIQRMIKTSALRKFGAKLNTRKFPGCESLNFDSDDYWNCYLRQLTLTVYHPVGTCKMALPTESGVVDHRLRVYGTNKLRVVDASVMPTLPSANTNAAVIMIAEKAADLIAEDFRSRRVSCHRSEIFTRNIRC